MKKCGKCGTIHDDNQFFCIDCNSSLGIPLSEEEEAKVNSKIKKTLTDLSNKADYFYVSCSDKLIAILLSAFSVLHVLLMLLRVGFYKETYLHVIGFILIILAVATSIDLRFPRLTWELYKLRLTLAIENPEDMEPSGFMLWSRRFFSKLVLAIMAVSFIIFLFY